MHLAKANIIKIAATIIVDGKFLIVNQNGKSEGENFYSIRKVDVPILTSLTVLLAN